MSAWFERNQFGNPQPGKIYTIFNNLREARQDPADHLRFKEPDAKMVMGYIVPPFQRELVWTEEQKIRLVDSARRCVPLGTFTINLTFAIAECNRVENGVEFYAMDYWLLDGQQRLNALEEFFDDKIRVHGCLWSDIGLEEQRHFLHTANFGRYETQFKTELECREYYDLMNFGGTPHLENQRAMRLG